RPQPANEVVALGVQRTDLRRSRRRVKVPSEVVEVGEEECFRGQVDDIGVGTDDPAHPMSPAPTRPDDQDQPVA
ncbi:MAG: hypothetical protein QOF21_2095, partial [Actinomycetota bacterium]